jgi:hypothetical protein
MGIGPYHSLEKEIIGQREHYIYNCKQLHEFPCPRNCKYGIKETQIKDIANEMENIVEPGIIFREPCVYIKPFHPYDAKGFAK